MTTAINRLNAIANSVAGAYVARDELVEYLKYSVIAQSNILVVGPPGAAKSALFGDFIAHLDGQHGFFALTKGSTPETVLGPMSLKAIKDEDTFRYNISGMAPDCDFIFIDEVFKGNALTRNALLQVINERRFFNGNQMVTCPLRMASAASNEYPDAIEDAAFRDRFLTTIEVDYIADDYQRMRMVNIARKRGRAFAHGQVAISLAELDELHAESREVSIPDAVGLKACQINDAVSMLGQGAKIGDRRFAESFNLAAARALCHGRTVMELDDLEVFCHTAWRDPELRTEIQRLVLRTINPEIADITTYFDEIELGFTTFKQRLAEAASGNNADLKLSAHAEYMQMAGSSIDKMNSIIGQLAGSGRDIAKAQEFVYRAKERVEEASHLTWNTMSKTSHDSN